MACRGSGHVISNLGGTPKSVSCPWCEGSGTRREWIDAQASWAEREGHEQREGERPASGETAPSEGSERNT